MKHVRLFLSVPLLMLGPVGSSFAQVVAVPPVMSFQGRLDKPDGTPVPDGTYTVVFRLFSTPTGGTALWSHTLPVTVRTGTFAAILGGPTGTQSDPLASPLFAADRWLEIQVGSDPPLTPRQQMTSVAYAVKADSVKDGAIASASVEDDTITSADIRNGTLTAADLAPNLAWFMGGNVGSDPAMHSIGTNDNQALVFRTNSNERMRLASNGNLGIGIATPNFPLAFANTLGDKISLYDSGGVPGGVHYGFGIRDNLLQIHSSSQFSDIAFGYGSSSAFTETMRIKGNGRVGIGILDPSAKLEVVTEGATAVRAKSNLNNGTGVFAVANGPSAFGVHGFSNGGLAIYANGRAGGSSGWQIISDARYKEHIATLDNSLDTVLNLRGVTFSWRGEDFPEMNFTKGRQVGFIAQEVESVLPQIVHTDGKGYKSVIYANVVPVLVEAMKQQQKQMEEKQQQIDNLENENAELKALLDTVLKRLERLENDQRG